MKASILKRYNLKESIRERLEDYENAEEILRDYLPGVTVLESRNAMAFAFQEKFYILWKDHVKEKWCGQSPEITVHNEDDIEDHLQTCIKQADTLNSFDTFFFADNLKEAAFSMIAFVYSDQNRRDFSEMIEEMALTPEND